MVQYPCGLSHMPASLHAVHFSQTEYICLTLEGARYATVIVLVLEFGISCWDQKVALCREGVLMSGSNLPKTSSFGFVAVARSFSTASHKE